ncbi:hypothetical protein F4810DRAFT_716849 [Camillea tinctor]|nr:hypothetical protein F4810DRAFT_716849 [Camillea tinctor]
MSNVGKEDFEELTTKMDWPLFDRVFTSATAGMRKPELRFYLHVLDNIGLAGNQVVFIDDKEKNGWRYLFQNAKQCDSVTESGVTFADNFAKLLIVDSLQDQTLVDLSWGSRKTWNFFTSQTALVPGGFFPDDLDTTSLALKVLRPSSTETVMSVLDTMAKYIKENGTFQTYFDRNRARSDPVVSANILACFYFHNRGHEFENCCLGFIGRLLRSSSDSHLQTTLGPLLKSRVRERLGLGGSASDLAMRIITEDGSWESGWIYQYGSGMKIGNCRVTTAMAVAALSSQDIAK